MANRVAGLILGTLAVMGAAAPAYAADEQVTVERNTAPTSTIGVVAKDGLYGGIAGAAVGGGILLIQNDGWNGSTMALATGIGLLAGVGFGVFDAATQHPAATAMRAPDASRPIERAQAANQGLPQAFSLQHTGNF